MQGDISGIKETPSPIESQENSFTIDHLLSRLQDTDSSTPAQSAHRRVQSVDEMNPALFIETSFDKPAEEEVEQEANELWSECEKAIDQVQSQKEGEIMSLMEEVTIKKLEGITILKESRDNKMKIFGGTPEEKVVLNKYEASLAMLKAEIIEEKT